MPRSYADAYLPLWENALDEEIGLYVETNDIKALVNTLYETRKNSGDPRLEELCLLLPTIDDKQIVFIAKKATEMPE